MRKEEKRTGQGAERCVYIGTHDGVLIQSDAACFDVRNMERATQQSGS